MAHDNQLHGATLNPADLQSGALLQQLIAKVGAVHSRIEEAMAHAGGDPAARVRVRAALDAIEAVESRLAVGGLSSADLATLSSSIDVARETAEAFDHPSAGQHAALSAAEARATMRAVGRDLFERHVLDPYLHFDSAADQAEYRRREAERQRAIEEARSQHTPVGDYRVALLTQDQIRDAGAHGATASPDFDGLVARADQGTAAALAEVTRTGGNTASVESSVRRQTDAMHGEPVASPTHPSIPDTTGNTARDLASIAAVMQGAGVVAVASATDGHPTTTLQRTAATTVRTV